MELLLKVYYDKPSRLGVRYTYEFQARKAYEELVREHCGATFFITLEPVRGRINLVLQALQSDKKIVYKYLDHRPDLLSKLQSVGGRPFEFVHLYSETGTVMVAKPFRKQEFFTISEYEVIGAQNF